MKEPQYVWVNHKLVCPHCKLTYEGHSKFDEPSCQCTDTPATLDDIIPARIRRVFWQMSMSIVIAFVVVACIQYAKPLTKADIYEVVRDLPRK
jgi:hypothetical protein